MSNRVLFQMWGPFRESLIKRHLFYVEQAKNRLLAQFEDIEAESDREVRKWLEQNGPLFDPDHYDSGDYYEWANDAGIELYGLLSDMRDQTRLSFVAGMFHEWDKQLRDWLVREIQHWHRGNNLKMQVWSANFLQIIDLLEGCGWDVRGKSYFRALDACRLVVNVFKHGDGKSLEDLKNCYPEYLDDPFVGDGGGLCDLIYRDHTYLKVSDEQIQEFSKSIENFWRDVPENMSLEQVSNIPQWFEKAIAKDRAHSRNA